MVPDEVGKQLHEKATRGIILSAEEQALLTAWYGRLDAEDIAILTAIRRGEKAADEGKIIPHGLVRNAGLGPDEAEQRNMHLSLDNEVSLRTAYLIMYTFVKRYWERGQRSDDLTDFIVNIGPVGKNATCDPAQIHDWLEASAIVARYPEGSWSELANED